MKGQSTKELLRDDCEEIMRKLIAKHPALCPENRLFDVWDNNDAAEIVADLIIEIKKSGGIEDAMAKTDWGL